MNPESQSEQTLHSLDNMQRAAMPAALQARIMAAVPARKGKIFALGRPTVILIAAGLALLVGFNIYSLSAHSNHGTKPAAIARMKPNPLADEYFAPAPSI